MQPDSFSASYDDPTATLTVAGDVDEAASLVLRQALEDPARTERGLTVDLSDVTLLPSFGVGVIAVALRQAADAGRTLELVASKGTIAQRVLEICGLPYRTA